MFGLLVLLFFAVPLAELALIITVGQRIGAFETIALLIVISVVGAWLARWQGFWVLGEIRRRMAQGEMPGQELVDGLLILVGAVLLLTPGFITDAVALLLLIPPVRGILRVTVRRRLERRIDVQVWGPPPAGPPPPSGPPSGRPPSGGPPSSPGPGLPR